MADTDKIEVTQQPAKLEDLLLKFCQMLGRDQYQDRRHDRELTQLRAQIEQLAGFVSPEKVVELTALLGKMEEAAAAGGNPFQLDGTQFSDRRLEVKLGGKTVRFDAECNVKIEGS